MGVYEKGEMSSKNLIYLNKYIYLFFLKKVVPNKMAKILKIFSFNNS